MDDSSISGDDGRNEDSNLCDGDWKSKQTNHMHAESGHDIQIFDLSTTSLSISDDIIEGLHTLTCLASHDSLQRVEMVTKELQ